MQRDLLDALRCPGTHEESWLVAKVLEANGPTLLVAELACPVCGAAFRIDDGVAYFADLAPIARHPPAWPTEPYTSDMVLRLAALLGVAESRFPVGLVGLETAGHLNGLEAVTRPAPRSLARRRRGGAVSKKR